MTLAQSCEVMVVPAGSFRVIGRVIELGLGIPVSAARVSVTAGSARGLSATTDGDGRYRLYGAAGDTELLASRSTYRSHTRRVIVSDHHTVDFEPGAQPIVPVEGTYTLTITEAARCRDQLLEELRIRSYAAEMTRNGRSLLVTLSGATFVGGANRIYGWLHADNTAVLTLGDPSTTCPGLSSASASTGYLSADGPRSS